MKALVWTAPERMELQEIATPTPGPCEVLVKVEVVGICGSEIEGYLGHNSLRVPPLVMGHEFCGIVVACGEGADGFKPGTRVVVNPLSACGGCNACAKRLPQLCASRRIVGIHRPGAFGEWVVVPASGVVPVSDGISPFRAALAEPLACSLRATRRAMERHPGANVVVFGAGGIGLLCAKAAKILGARAVMIIDTNPLRLDIAAATAADAVFDPRSGDPKDAAAAFGGELGVDVVVDAAGFQPTRSSAVDIVNPGGTIMNVGLGIDQTSMPVNVLIRNEIEVLGSFCYTEQDFHDAVRLLEDGRVTESGWTEIRRLDEGGRAFQELVEGKVTLGKILLAMEGERA